MKQGSWWPVALFAVLWVATGVVRLDPAHGAAAAYAGPDDARATRWTTRSKGQTTTYAAAPRHGFDVRVDARLLTGGEAAELGAAALAELDAQLHQIVRKARPAALEKLRAVPIWVGQDDPVAPCACYHPSPEWLRQNGFDAQKAKAVEIANAAHFVAWTREQPWMVLHELAHGVDDRLLQASDGPASWGGRLDALWRAARDAGSYDAVLHWDGGTVRHYALNTSDEYFAEASEAWFGTNDFFPFVHPELLQHDPELCKLLAEVWGDPITSKG